MTISSSPDRYTFQKENYIKRKEEQGLEPLEEYIEMFKTWKEQDEANMVNPDWQENNMEYDLRTTDWILEKVRNSNGYAQNLYAAMCNNEFQKNEFMPRLAGRTWGCSWRHAGGIIADMREEGDYIDWYCSGIRNDAPVLLDEQFAELTEDQKKYYIETKSYVGEQVVTDEIRADLKKLGWDVMPDRDDDCL
jgi:hypothetical protein